MRKTILEFAQQFSFRPVIANAKNLKRLNKFVVAGMGGSNAVTDLIKARDPFSDIIVHKNYGLPNLSEEELSSRLIIANSYSGNTEETMDVLGSAFKKGLNCAVVSKGGRLIEFAKKLNIAYCQLPDTGIQPRASLGFQLKALLKIMNRQDLLTEASQLAKTLHAEDYEKPGRKLSQKIKGFVPIIYASAQNIGIAYNWKIKFNETGKIPAFYNVFPELNHNEMTGFDSVQATNIKASARKMRKKFQQCFYCIFLKDKKDHPKVQKRMEVTKKLYQDRGLSCEVLGLSGKNVFYKIFASLILADWTAFYTAQIYGLESEQVPIVEKFKKMI